MHSITALSLYIINQVRLRRLVLGISARQLSLKLKHGEVYVSNIESQLSQGQYPPHELPRLAEVLNCEVHDLLPPKDLNLESEGELVEKIILQLDKVEDFFKVVEGLIKNGFLGEGKSKADIGRHLFMDEPAQFDAMETVLADLVTNSKLSHKNNQYQI